MQHYISTLKHRPTALLMLALVASLVFSVQGIFGRPVAAQAPHPVWRVDASGNITKDGVPFRVKGVSWFGLGGRYEIATDPVNPRGAPMEQYMGNVFWNPSSRTYASDITEFKQLGINLVRLPLVTQTLKNAPCDPQGLDPVLKNSTSVRIQCARTALETVIRELNTQGVYVLLDIHSCSNYVDWRKGRLDARPPWADATRENYDFKREEYSCAATNNPPTVTTTHPYDLTKWKADLRTLAGLPAALGVTNIMGIDIFNEPHDYTWAEWRSMIDTAYAEINAVNTNILVFAEGIGTTPGMQDGSPTTFTQEPHGVLASNPNWGENLFSAGTNPPTMPKNRLVYSPHTYGPSVFVQKMFMDPAQPACAGLEGDAAAAAQCNIVINPSILWAGWDEHFGYLKAQGYAIVIGEFGGNMQWPDGKASLRDQQMWGFLPTSTVDQQWQNTFVDYLLSRGITDSIYWSVNPESGDTGGLYTTPYQPGSNEAGWGAWGAVDQTKLTLLKRLWDAAPAATPTPCGSCPTNTPTNTPGPTNTPTNTLPVTNTPTNTPVPPTPTPCGTCSLKVQHKQASASTTDGEIKPHLRIHNNGGTSVTLSTLKMRYWYTRDTAQPQTINCDYAQVGCGNVTFSFVQITPVTGADFYLEVGFTAGAGSVAAGGNSGEIQARFNKNDWSAYNELDDWSFAANASFADNSKVTLYQSGALVWGSEPGGGGPTNTPAPTNTPTNTLAATNTPTNTPVNTPTRTNTPTGPTNTPTNTSVPTNTPTRTNTPAVTNTPTNTPVASNTPTNTPAPTATPGGSNLCASPTVITGGGSYSVPASGVCFKYVNATFTRGAMWSVMNGSDSTVSNVVKWYGGRNETVTNCINDTQTLNGNGAQINNFTVAKDSANAMYVTITTNKVNTVSMSIQNWQNGTGCSVAPTPQP